MTLCRCGSGRERDACHGSTDAAGAPARAALAVAHDLAAHFPVLRLDGAAVVALAGRAAATLADGEPAPPELVAEGAALVSERERTRLIRTARALTHWATLCADAGGVDPVERALVTGAVEAAIGERRPTPRALLAVLEYQLPRDAPGPALAFVLPPGCVWAITDVCAALDLVPPQADSPAVLAAVDAVVAERVDDGPTDRVRRLAGRLASELPWKPFPRASALLTEACRRVAADRDFARGIAALLLSAYVTALAPIPASSVH